MSRYRELLRRRGAGSVAAACAFAWLSYSGYSLAIVLAVREATGSFGVAGAAVAAFAGVSAVVSPARGRHIDANGPRALIPLLFGHGALLAALAICVAVAAPPAVLVALAGAMGLLTPPIIATARAVWTGVAGPALAPTAHALNAALGDGALVVGPPMIAGIAALMSPAIALAALLPGIGVGVGLLVAHSDTVESARPERTRRGPVFALGPLAHSAGLRLLVIGELLSGIWLGAVDVIAPVEAAREGSAALGAVPLALFAVGSIGMSLIAGSGRLGDAPGKRYVAGTVAVTAALLAGGLVEGLVGFSVAMLGIGACFGVMNVAVFELLDLVVEERNAVEALTWLTTAQGAGLAIGSALSGVAASGERPARLTLLLIPSGVSAVVVLARRRPLVRS